jgi:predicted HAD superfamily Cof-like phosphohydrolase
MFEDAKDIFDADLVQQLDDLADILKTFPYLRYLQLIVPSDDRPDGIPVEPPISRASVVEKTARKAMKVLCDRGLSLEFFTLEIRYPEHQHTYAVEDCHLRVRASPETVSEKVLGRQMDRFGDLKYVTFEELVKRETGHVYTSKGDVEEWSEDEEE